MPFFRPSGWQKKVWVVLGIVFITIPAIFANYWSLFSSTPIYQWLFPPEDASHPKTMNHHLSPTWLYWIPTIIGIVILLFILFVSIQSQKQNQNPVVKPKRKTKEERNREVEEKILRRNFPERFNLEIAPIICDLSKNPQNCACQIRVHNPNENKSADDLQVELLEMEMSSETKEYYRPTIPRFLLPDIKDRKNINPGGDLVFNLFYAFKGGEVSVIRLYAYFVNDRQVMQKNIAVFEANTNYPLRIRATARDFPAVTTDWNLNFIAWNNGYRFTLTKAQLDEPVLLSIHSADWWIEDKHLNVTKIVRSYLIDSKIQMPCEISILSDPRPYLGKILTIDYSIGGKRTQKIFKEHDIISQSDLK